MVNWDYQHAYRGGPMVAVQGDCIIGRHLQGNGYARITTSEGRHLAHRVTWENAHGPIPDGYQIHHRCGAKACVNVEHLELIAIGDHARLHVKPSTCGHPERIVRPTGRSYCPVCQRVWHNNGAARRRAQRRERYQNDPVYRARRLEENRRYRNG